MSPNLNWALAAAVIVSAVASPLAAEMLAESGALAPLCIHMHVGSEDTGWREAMTAQADALRERGHSGAFEVEPGQTHRLDTVRDGLADRLFAGLEAARGGCAAE